MINCEEIVSRLKNNIKNEIETLNIKPHLAIIQVGDNPASNNYIKGKLKDCNEVGIEAELIKLPENISHLELGSIIIDLNNSDEIHGIILQLPLPETLQQYEQDLIDLISIKKDVDGFRKESSFISCTPLGVLTLLNELDVDLTGKTITLVGYGKLVNRPLCNLLSDKGATVIICRSHTPEQVLGNCVSMSDIVITATGKRNLIKADYINKNNPPIIIDCGITIENGKQYGDCSEEIYNIVDLCTPKVKGMGLFTRVSLLQNTIKAYNNININ